MTEWQYVIILIAGFWFGWGLGWLLDWRERHKR